MSQARMNIGCPECESTVNAPVPQGSGIDDSTWGEPNRLQGMETRCRNCGHELELYYY